MIKLPTNLKGFIISVLIHAAVISAILVVLHKVNQPRTTGESYIEFEIVTIPDENKAEDIAVSENEDLPAETESNPPEEKPDLKSPDSPPPAQPDPPQKPVPATETDASTDTEAQSPPESTSPVPAAQPPAPAQPQDTPSSPPPTTATATPSLAPTPPQDSPSPPPPTTATATPSPAPAPPQDNPSPPPPPATATPSSPPAEALQNEREILSPIRPVYPKSARRSGKEGNVTLEIEVAETGIPGHVKVISTSGHPGLDEAAVKAAKKAVFSKASQTDTVRQTISFKIR